MKSGAFQKRTREGRCCVCVSGHVCTLLFIAPLLCNMCFRGTFSGGASAKDKGHWGHRKWFLCSSGFQIIQGWYKGAFCPSFSPFPSLSLSFHSVSYWISLSAKLCRLSRDSPDQIKHSFSAVCSDLRRFHQALHCSPPPKRQHPHKSRSRQQPSSVSPLCLPLPPPLVVQMQTKHRSHYWNVPVSEGAGIRFVGARGCFWKDRRQHVTANLHRPLGHILVGLTQVRTPAAAARTAQVAHEQFTMPLPSKSANAASTSSTIQLFYVRSVCTMSKKLDLYCKINSQNIMQRVKYFLQMQYSQSLLFENKSNNSIVHTWFSFITVRLVFILKISRQWILSREYLIVF